MGMESWGDLTCLFESLFDPLELIQMATEAKPRT